MENFRSDSALLRHEIKKILADGKEHFRKDIMEDITKRYSERDLSPGKWAGVFRAVLKEPGYISPNTGSYQFVGAPSTTNAKNSSTFNTCIGILKTALEEIEKEVKNSSVSQKSPLDLSQAEFAEVQQIRNLTSKLKELVNNQ